MRAVHNLTIVVERFENIAVIQSDTDEAIPFVGSGDLEFNVLASVAERREILKEAVRTDLPTSIAHHNLYPSFGLRSGSGHYFAQQIGLDVARIRPKSQLECFWSSN